MDGSRSCAGLRSEPPIVCHMKAPLFPSEVGAPQLSSHFCCCGSRGQIWLRVNAALMRTSPDPHLASGSPHIHPCSIQVPLHGGRWAALVMAHIRGVAFLMETLTCAAWGCFGSSVGLQD